jgi:hypothetical protein
LLCKSFESRYELRNWCLPRLKQLKDPIYLEDQRLKADEEKRLAREAKEQRRRETPEIWEHYNVRHEEANRRAREVDAGGTTSERWLPPRSLPCIFPPSFFQNLTFNCNSCLKGSHGCICYILLVVVSIDELDIDSIDEFEKIMPRLHPKPEGDEPEYYYGDVCKMQVSGDYKTLCQRFWMCNSLTYNPKPGDTEVRINRLFSAVSSRVLNEF